MRLYVDEHVDVAIVRGLTRHGCDVVRGVDRHPPRTPDEVHFADAVQERRVFVTRDADFLRMDHAYQESGKQHAGIIYWPQVRRYGIGHVIRSILGFLQRTTEEERRNRIEYI